MVTTAGVSAALVELDCELEIVAHNKLFVCPFAAVAYITALAPGPDSALAEPDSNNAS